MRLTLTELQDKIEWEGGVLEAISYGISEDDLPEDTPPKIVNAWRKLMEANTYWLTYEREITVWLEEAVDDEAEEEELDDDVEDEMII